MKITLTLMEFALLQKIARGNFARKEWMRWKHLVTPMFHCSLCTYGINGSLQITETGRKVLREHSPYIVNTSEVSIPQYT